MAIRTYTPGLSVTLHKTLTYKNGNAQRYQASQRSIDLTPYLGDGSSIQISKSIYRPDGTWQISLPDIVDPTTADTFYSLISPMDVVEIRGSPTAFQYTGSKLPLLMRGFVSSIRRSESMSDAGPQRSVIVSGQDWGKLWMIHGLWMQVAVSQEVPLLTTYQLQAALGIETSLYGVGAFMQQMTNLVINRKIKEMQAFSDPAFLPLFSCNPPSGIQGLIAPAALGLFQRGPFWNIIKGFSDSPRNELWISDSDATGPTLVLRPTPYKDINGNWIGGATDPGTINLDQIDIVAIDAGRSDEKVANFFWTSPGNSEIFAPNQVHAGDILAGDPFDFNYTNNNPSLFGYREMQWPTSLIPNTVAAYPLKQAPAQQLQSAANIVTWHKQRGELLKAMNRDNVVFEDVAITARGSEAYQVGQYLQVTRNKVVSQCYLTRLAHVIQPFGSWETTLYGERGTGFLVRNKMEQSPFWAEGRPGVYARASSTSTAA